MKISEINIIPKNFNLETPFKFASCTLEYLPYALIQVKTNKGINGYGECPTYWDPSGETQDSAIGAINLIKEKLIGRHPFNIEEILNFCDKNIYGAFAAKCGLDMALLDIKGKELGTPIYNLLGGKNYPVKVNAIMPLGSLDEAFKKAKSIEDKGYEYVKVKVGVNLKKELEIIDALFADYPNYKYFIDANQGWGTAKEALNSIKKFEKYNLAWVEQPTKAFDWEGLRFVKENTTIPIMADESLYSYQDAIKMIKMNVADMFNIKLAKCGGMHLGGKLKAVADGANIPCVIGSMIESSLGSLANYNFATAYEMKVGGLSAFQMITNDYDFGLKIENGKLIRDKELPGLGYPDEKVLEKEFE